MTTQSTVRKFWLRVLTVCTFFTLIGSTANSQIYCRILYDTNTGDYIDWVEIIGEPCAWVIDCHTGFGPNTTPISNYYNFLIPSDSTSSVLARGQSYTLRIRGISTNGPWNTIACWFDWNDDGDFGDAQEIITTGTQATAATNYVVQINFTVPLFTPLSMPLVAPTPSIRFRIRQCSVFTGLFYCGNNPPSPVGNYRGETEDYEVVIIDSTSAVPGGNTRTWFGYTNDWNDPNNWCIGVPTLNDVVVIPGNTGTPGYYCPLIYEGVHAEAKNVRVVGNDSIIMDAKTNASLHVEEQIYNQGVLQIGQGSSTSGKIGVGNTATNALETPFSAFYTDVKSFMMYTAAELTALGMTAGDVITQMDLEVLAVNGTRTYDNYNMFFYHTTDIAFTGAADPVQSSARTLFYSAATYTIPAAPGTISFPIVGNAVKWDGVNNIVIEICYDNTYSAPQPNPSHDQLESNNVGFNRFKMYYTSIFWPFPNLPQPDGCTFTTASTYGPGGLAWAVGKPISQKRPNITFHYTVPYDAFPIFLGGDWDNDGLFNQAKSRVIFDGTGGQLITGTSFTTFSEVELKKPSGTVNLLNAFTYINDSLIMRSGQLNLNFRKLYMNSSNIGVFKGAGEPAGFNGFIVSDAGPPAYGSVVWSIGNTTGDHMVPFGTSLGVEIPFHFDLKSGNVGDMEVGTYGTVPLNTPYPNAGNHNVIHVNNPAGLDNSAHTVDRFWIIEVSNNDTINNLVDLKFTYANAEQPSLSPNTDKIAQRWEAVIPAPPGPNPQGWENRGDVPNRNIRSAGANLSHQVNAIGVNKFSPWTIANASNPLPVELIEFDAAPVDSRSKIWWTTASEIDVNHFTVERTIDGKSFEFIGRRYSEFNSSSVKEYELYDDNPVSGVQYYRLTTEDIDGSTDVSDLVAVRHAGSKNPFDITSMYFSTNDKLEVVFDYDSDENLNVTITDVSGKIVYERSNVGAQPGVNNISIDQNLSEGVYLIRLQNSDASVTDKFLK